MDSTSRTRALATAYVERTEKRDWSGLTELLAEDLVYELPQSRERIRGRSKFLQFDQEYPGDWHLSARRVVADGPYAAIWIDAGVDGEPQDACIWLDVSDEGLITRITDYWPEPSEPMPGREHLVERW